MKRISLLMGITFSLSALFVLPSASGQQSMAAPGIFFLETRYVFPETVDGNHLQYDFVYENRGDAPLSIEKVVSSCGCTAAYFDKRVMAGGTGRVTVKVDTTGYGGGKMEQTLEVYSNDPLKPVTTLFITGEVIEFAKISKRIIQLKGKKGESVSDTLDILPVMSFQIIETIAEPGTRIRVSLNEIRVDGKVQYRLTVHHMGDQAGRYFEKIILRTDNSLRPELIIPVQGQIGEAT